MVVKKNYLFLISLFALSGGLLFYFLFNPESNSFLLKCPFKIFTGFDCPGCGSQRALHSLLHGEFQNAFSYNPLFIIAIPYVFAGVLFEWFGLKYTYPKVRKILFGTNAIYAITVLIIFYFIGRNL